MHKVQCNHGCYLYEGSNFVLSANLAHVVSGSKEPAVVHTTIEIVVYTVISCVPSKRKCPHDLQPAAPSLSDQLHRQLKASFSRRSGANQETGILQKTDRSSSSPPGTQQMALTHAGRVPGRTWACLPKRSPPSPRTTTVANGSFCSCVQGPKFQP